MLPLHENPNYTVFRDCFSSALMQRVPRSSPKPRKKRAAKAQSRTKTEVERKQKSEPEEIVIRQSAEEQSNLAAELADFSEYLASETFSSLPAEAQELSYSQIQASPKLAEKYSNASISAFVEQVIPVVPVSVTESLDTYDLLSPGTSFGPLFAAALASYLDSVTEPPPVWSTTRSEACEICARDWVPLTYHHLIPKAVHARVLKRGWHEEWKLNSVAWLCRACHSFVHRIAGNEELAKDWFSVERLMEREDVQDWSKWVGRVRWKAR